MYYIYGVSVPSLLIESTDSMIVCMIKQTIASVTYWGEPYSTAVCEFYLYCGIYNSHAKYVILHGETKHNARKKILS